MDHRQLRGPHTADWVLHWLVSPSQDGALHHPAKEKQASAESRCTSRCLKASTERCCLSDFLRGRRGWLDCSGCEGHLFGGGWRRRRGGGWAGGEGQGQGQEREQEQEQEQEQEEDEEEQEEEQEQEPGVLRIECLFTHVRHAAEPKLPLEKSHCFLSK